MPDWVAYLFEEPSFEKKVQKVFEYQVEQNTVFRRFCEALGYTSATKPDEIPLLPIQAFKETELTTQGNGTHDLIFKSSGTSGMSRSRHMVANAEIYRQSIRRGFDEFYDLNDFVIWAYLPRYSENPDSSLVWMLNELIGQEESGMSRFLPLDKPLDKEKVEKVKGSGKQLMIFGAAFGLLDLLEQKPVKLPGNSIVIETGGMKTHRREVGKDSLHRQLAAGFGLDRSRVHSEYGMAELLSQAYATGGQWFRPVPWMQVTIRNPDDPREILPPFYEGLIGIIDLANVHSCSFLLTGDKGIKDKKGRFQVLGRWNPKDLRGCNFLIEED